MPIDRWMDKEVVVYIHNGILSSVQSSSSVVSDSLWPHEPQQARPPCPSPTPGVHPNPCPLSRWCHPTSSSSVIPFSSCLHSFPGPGSFQMSELLLSHKKEHIWVSSNEVDGPRTCYTEWNKSERGDKYHILTHIYMESRKMILKNLFTGQQWRNRHRE